MQSLSSFVKPILFLPGCNSDSWRRYTLKCLCWGKGGRVSSAYRSKWGLLWGLLCGTSGRRKLCMVPCCSCHIYGIWRSKKVEKTLKSWFGVAMQATWRDNFSGKEGSSFCNTAVLKLYSKSYWVLKLYYRILPLFPITAVSPVLYLYWNWQGQKYHLKCS